MGRIEGREANERTSLGDENLILSQMSGGSVVFAVCDTPGVEWNSETDGRLIYRMGRRRPVEVHTQSGGSSQRYC